jgi:hypothetical protein
VVVYRKVVSVVSDSQVHPGGNDLERPAGAPGVAAVDHCVEPDAMSRERHPAAPPGQQATCLLPQNVDHCQ